MALAISLKKLKFTNRFILSVCHWINALAGSVKIP
jgi:hypothetical protein